MKWISIMLMLLAVGGCWLYKSMTFIEADIYIRRLVYVKKDRELFTGLLKVDNNASQLSQSFCNGIPCGKYAEQQKGGSYICRGEYIASDEFAAIKKEFVADTITVDLLQAGGDIASDPYCLNVTVLRNDDFFKDKNNPLPSSTRKLIEAAMHDTKKLHYDYLTITFANAVYNATRYRCKECKVIGDRVIEVVPAYEEWQLKNGVMQQVMLN